MGYRVAMIGDGQMGLVLAEALVEHGVEVTIWGPFADDIETLATTRRSRRLPDYELPAAVGVTADDRVVEDVDLVVNAIPTQFIRGVWEGLGPRQPNRTPVVCVSKGIENGTLLRPSEIIAETLTAVGRDASPMCSLSGPTVAAELARRLPATMVAASSDATLAERTQEVFTVPWIRVYTHDDHVGVEVAGAAKNVIAIAAGMVDGLGAGLNAKSALLARGIAEIARLGVAMGARLDTFFGVAGVGDLATTCFSPYGRNRTCGERLATGESLDTIIETTPSIIEGVPTTRSIVELAGRLGVDMPITRAVHAILFEGLTPAEAIDGLMRREAKAERIG